MILSTHTKSQIPWIKKHPQTIMEPPSYLTVGTTQSGIMLSSALCQTKICCFDSDISNLDSSVQRTFLKSSSVQCRWVRAHCIRFILFSGLNSGFWMATWPNNLACLNRLFIVVNDTGLDQDLFTSARFWVLLESILLIGNGDEFILSRSGSSSPSWSRKIFITASLLVLGYCVMNTSQQLKLRGNFTFRFAFVV